MATTTRTRRPNAAERRVARILAWEREQRALPGVFIGGLRTVNELNRHEHWRARQRRAKLQRALVTANLIGQSLYRRLPFVVTLTRYAPGTLDAHDGLPASMKFVADAVAATAGVDDRDERIGFGYAQEPAPAGCYGVRLRIEPREAR
jgi:hypothetical protein